MSSCPFHSIAEDSTPGNRLHIFLACALRMALFFASKFTKSKISILNVIYGKQVQERSDKYLFVDGTCMCSAIWSKFINF